MPTPTLDPIVLGHNGFFGVNHLSKKRGAEQEAAYEETQSILNFIEFAGSHDVNALMVSTHPRATPLARTVAARADLKDTLKWYPLLPYLNKYVRAANEKGMVNVVMDQVKGAGVIEKLKLFGKGGLGVVRKDYGQLLQTLIEMEMVPFKGVRVEAVFLHDVLTDLMLAYDAPDIAELYIKTMTKKFKTQPAFATKNLPGLLERFNKWGIDPGCILTHVNQIGFNMNPSREVCETALRTNKVPVMAMGSLASGYLKPADAFPYISSLKRDDGTKAVDSIVVGVTRKDHAEETFRTIKTAMDLSTSMEPT